MVRVVADAHWRLDTRRSLLRSSIFPRFACKFVGHCGSTQPADKKSMTSSLKCLGRSDSDVIVCNYVSSRQRHAPGPYCGSGDPSWTSSRAIRFRVCRGDTAVSARTGGISATSERIMAH